jgi:hypothetical protein
VSSPRAERRVKHSRCMELSYQTGFTSSHTTLLYQCSRHIFRSHPISRSTDLYLQIYRSVSLQYHLCRTNGRPYLSITGSSHGLLNTNSGKPSLYFTNLRRTLYLTNPSARLRSHHVWRSRRVQPSLSSGFPGNAYPRACQVTGFTRTGRDSEGLREIPWRRRRRRRRLRYYPFVPGWHWVPVPSQEFGRFYKI